MTAKSNVRWPAVFLVVGVDGSAGAVHALRRAADLATRSGETLVVIHAWSYLPGDAAAPHRDRRGDAAAARPVAG
jgi:nucleotide-binding universal stress UspA family protein